MKKQYTTIAPHYGDSVYLWEPLGRRRNKGREYRLSYEGKLRSYELSQLCVLPSGHPRLLARIRRLTDEWWPLYERDFRVKGKYTWPRTGTLVPKVLISELLDISLLETNPTRDAV